jgi:hypothetical protein
MTILHGKQRLVERVLDPELTKPGRVLLLVRKRCLRGFFDQWLEEEVVAMDAETCISNKLPFYLKVRTGNSTYLCQLKRHQAVKLREWRIRLLLISVDCSNSFRSCAIATARSRYVHPILSIPHISNRKPIRIVACRVVRELLVVCSNSQSLFASAKNLYPRLCGFQNSERSGLAE